ncbi:MAG: YcjX family protein [Pararhodobacter sp.]|nr:YcjX family protein [Pararhodobacter sp.]
MVIGTIAGQIGRTVDTVGATVSEAFFEPVLRLGVTGLSRAGKTVFITSLVTNLLEPARMTALTAAQSGRMSGVWLQPQPDMTLPRFDYETHLAALTGPQPHWPESTRAISELRLSFRLAPSGLTGMLTGALTGPRRMHIDIVDYPGEWLLDLGLMARSHADWSRETLERLQNRPEAARYLALMREIDPAAPHDETEARRLAAAFTDYLHAARAAGLSDCTPGRCLWPGDLAGSPVLTFAPLPEPANPRRGSLWREMQRRYDGYCRQVVRPFFETHFARIDRQVVLVDLIEAVQRGPAALEDLRRTLAEVLAAFRPGGNSFLSTLLRGRRVEKILFAATKADHLHHSQHPQLGALAEAMLAEARDRARFSGAETAAMAIAALRATIEDQRIHQGRQLDLVRGRLKDGRQAAFHAGDLPADPARLLTPARQGAATWPAGEYAATHFAPPLLDRRPGEGLPHIRLDRAAQFLLGDWLA